MRIEIDRDRCTGLGVCEAEVPDLFEVGDDGLVVCHDQTPSDDLLVAVQAACDGCPTGALSISGAVPA